MNSKPRRQASNQNVTVDGIECSRKVELEDRDRIVSVSRWHLYDDHECIQYRLELFQWSGAYNRLTGED